MLVDEKKQKAGSSTQHPVGVELPDASQIETIVKKYDAESNFRNLTGITAKITGILCIVLSLFHVYTAGFGLLNEVTHRTVHLTLVLGLVFLVFPRQTPGNKATDWGFGLCFAGFYLFLAWQLANRFADQMPLLGKVGLIALIFFIAITALPLRQLKGEGDELSFSDWPLVFLSI